MHRGLNRGCTCCSTNMSMQDAGALGQCVRAWKKDLRRALKEYEVLRVPQTAKDVLFSRHIGEVRQGRWFDPVAFNWPEQVLTQPTL